MIRPIEDRLSIDLPDLKRRGYFGSRRLGSIDWQLGNRIVASVQIQVKIDNHEPQNGGTLYICYQKGEVAYREIIALIYVRSNLGRGGIWYFVCPTSGKRCRRLINSASGFVSRHSEGLRYRAQLESRKERATSSGLRELRKKMNALSIL